MKRFHVHLHVQDLEHSIGFYSKLFAAAPTRVERDYAKWMLDDPRLNFAISTRGAPGVDHLGFQTDDDAELAALQARAEAADLPTKVEGDVSCCYARSRKHWVVDPQGVAWEHFQTLADVATFGGEARAPSPAAAAACCAPAPAQTAAKPACCG